MLPFTLRAPAKLNLFLHIEGRLANGYHAVESLVAFTELADTLRIAAADTLSLESDGAFADAAGAAENNLVLKAARALQAHTGYGGGAKLSLTKNIPVGAGLGGGSADAAAALHGLNHGWGLNLSLAELQALALPLGADVPMCLAGVPAFARGIGEVLTPLAAPLPPLSVLLVHPRVPLLTAEVYAAFARLPPPRAARWPGDSIAEAAELLAALRRTRNHLQPAAIAVSPHVAEVLLALETLHPAPDLVRMTGSGACCFALYADAAHATAAHAQMLRDYPAWWVCLSAFSAP